METLASESGLYRFLCAFLRFWFSHIFRRLRVLEPERLPRSGPVLLVVNHPAGFVEALIVIAGLNRRIHCLLDRSLLRGPFERIMARLLGMIPYNFEGEDWPAIFDSVSRLFSREEAVLVFARRAVETGRYAPEAATVAIEAEDYLAREAPLPVIPVHLFIPAPPSGAGEILIYIGPSLSPADAPWTREPDLDQSIRLLDEQIGKACCENPFRLQPEQVGQFISGLESLMREELADEWSQRPNWKQRVEDFDISPFFVRLAHQLNYGHPGRLVAVNESLRNYEERKRRDALHALRVETAGPWSKSPGRRLAAWIETIVGFPVACYGLLNSLVAWFVLWLAGLMNRGLWEATPKEWVARAVVAAACYAGQIALAAHFLARADVGYYAPSVFISGAYVLRYLRLLERRTRVLTGPAAARRELARRRRMRRALIGELKRDQDRYAAVLKVAH
ncbi:MAG: 1-acyl-sn-glycerol-3-phosphate acyltransferase [Terriglobia bacterium]